MRKQLTIAICTLMASGLATARDVGPQWWTPDYQDEGLIIGGSYGETEAQISSSDFPNSSVRPKDNTWRAYIGGRANQILSVELGYADLGETNIRSNEQRIRNESETWFANITAALPITPELSVFAKGGWHRWKHEIRQETATAGGFLGGATASRETSTVRDNDPFWGAGIRYRFTPTAALRLEYERFRFDSSRDSIQDQDVMSAGLEFIF